MKITKEQFAAYEKVRVGGKTNMWDVQRGASLASLDPEVYFQILKQYEDLMAKYPDVRKN
jgi:hypothetical protein